LVCEGLTSSNWKWYGDFIH